MEENNTKDNASFESNEEIDSEIYEQIDEENENLLNETGKPEEELEISENGSSINEKLESEGQEPFIDELISIKNTEELEMSQVLELDNNETSVHESQGNLLTVNPGKNESILYNGKNYSRYAIKTHIITGEDDILDVVKKYAKEHIQDGDILFISEKAIACSEKRAIKSSDVKVGFLAKFLSERVYKSPHGEGLRHPQSMQLAIKECGVVRILFAAFMSVIGKIIGKRGWFYTFAGQKVASIDPPAPYNMPPFDEYIVLGPKNPQKTAIDISIALNCKVSIVDVNDINSVILGSSSGVDEKLVANVLKDNPLGQTNHQTPMGIIRAELE